MNEVHSTFHDSPISRVSVDPVIAHVDSLIAAMTAFEEICALDIQRSEPFRYEAAETAYLNADRLAFHTPATTLGGLLAQARKIAAENAATGAALVTITSMLFCRTCPVSSNG